MHDLSWERWLDTLAQEYFVAVFRPELPGPERLRAASRCREVLARLSDGGGPALAYLVECLVDADTRRRNAAARAVSVLGEREHLDALVACYLDEGRQWLAPIHLLRSARRRPLDARLAGRLGDLPLRVQPAVLQGLLARDRPATRSWLWTVVHGADASLAEAAVEAVGRWREPRLLWEICRRVDRSGDRPRALVVAGVQAGLRLALQGEAGGLDWLEEHTLDADPTVGALAHAALGVLAWPRCLPELADQLVSTDGRDPALGYLLEAADHLASAALVPALVQVVRAHVEVSGPGLDDNPADQAIRVLERMTGRWVSSELCSYDRHGNLDTATRRRAALLHDSVASDLDPDRRYRLGEPLSTSHLVSDLLSPSPSRVRAAACQLVARTGEDHGFDPREDLVANLEALLAWQRRSPSDAEVAGAWMYGGRDLHAVPTS